MGNTAIRWTPRNNSTETSLTFSATRGLNQFSGLVDVDRAMTISSGGKAVTVIHDAWHQYEVEARALSPVSERALHTGIVAFLSHALAGGEFVLELDSSKTVNTTSSAEALQSATTIGLTTTTGISADDVMFIEDVNDPTIFQRVHVSAVDTTNSEIDTKDGLFHTVPAGSVVRHAEYFPSCVMLEERSPFQERPAGRGNQLWDLRMTIRTVR